MRSPGKEHGLPESSRSGGSGHGADASPSPGDAGLPVVWSEEYEVDIGEHVYPTEKYRLVRERLLESGTVIAADLLTPSPATGKQLARVHDREYLRKIREGDFTRGEILTLEVPFSAELRHAMVLCAGGSVLAARRALEEGLAVHLGGGFHHAFADHGEGFCLLNDVAVALADVLAEGGVRRAAVVDCDVHQGNGTAAIFADDDRVYTVSVHQEWNYPAVKPPSDLDVGLPDGTGDDRYLEALREHLPRVLDEQDPELVFYLAGADPYRSDQLGGLSLTRDGLRRRDAYVLESARRRGIPAAVVLAGGYARRLRDTVDIHFGTVETARRLAAR